MASRRTHIGALVQRMPDEAKVKLKATLRKARGNVQAAARALEISSKHLRRYLIRLRLATALEEIRQTSGWHRPELRKGEKLTRWTRKKRRAKRAERRHSTRVENP